MARTLITLPPVIRRGDVVEVRTLIAHPMETGHRQDGEGRLLPRDIVRRFSCHYRNEPGDPGIGPGAVGELVFEADLYPAIAANPYLSFTVRAAASGTLMLRWEGDNGFVQTEAVALTVM